MYYKLEDVKEELDTLKNKGLQKGFDVGFNWNNLPYTIKLGSTTYIGAPPATGKTEFQKEILINLSCLHGWNHVVYTPETGSPAEVFSELCSAYIGKPYNKSSYQMSQTEMLQAEYFVNEHFTIIDSLDEEIDIIRFYDLVDEIEQARGKTIHTTTVDPWNELNEIYLPSDLGREDKFISRALGFVRKNARKKNRHNFIITHVRDQAMLSENGISYYPFPHAREIAGGQTWFKKGMTVLLLWRPPFGLTDNNSRPYGENELHVRIAKVKPKGTSERGTYIMSLDTQKYQYYFLDEISGEKTFSLRGEHNFNKKEFIKPLDISKIKSTFEEDNGDAPF